MRSLSFSMHPTKADYGKAIILGMWALPIIRRTLIIVSMLYILLLYLMITVYIPNVLAVVLNVVFLLIIIAPLAAAKVHALVAWESHSKLSETSALRYSLTPEGLRIESKLLSRFFSWTLCESITEIRQFVYLDMGLFGHIIIFKDRIEDAEMNDIVSILQAAPVSTKRLADHSRLQ